MARPRDQVRKLVAGPCIYLCDECIELCNEIAKNEEEFGEDVEMDFLLIYLASS